MTSKFVEKTSKQLEGMKIEHEVFANMIIIKNFINDETLSMSYATYSRSYTLRLAGKSVKLPRGITGASTLLHNAEKRFN